MADPGDEVAAHLLGFLAHGRSALQLGRHVIERLSQFRHLVATGDTNPRVQLTGRNGARGGAQGIDLVGKGSR